ncbi:hypothetical protein D3C84_532510 [compost metagenome]
MIACVGMHHCPELVECNATIGGDADCEHQIVARFRAAFDHRAVKRQDHRLTRGRVRQPGGTGHHAQRIGQCARPISAKRRDEVGGKALSSVGCQYRLVYRQRGFCAGGADARSVVVENHFGADFDGLDRGLEQPEATDVKIGVVVALGVDGRSVLDEHAVVIRRCGVFNLVAGLDAADGHNPTGKAEDNAQGIRCFG